MCPSAITWVLEFGRQITHGTARAESLCSFEIDAGENMADVIRDIELGASYGRWQAIQRLPECWRRRKCRCCQMGAGCPECSVGRRGEG